VKADDRLLAITMFGLASLFFIALGVILTGFWAVSSTVIGG